jgi:hypothetical protein
LNDVSVALFRASPQLYAVVPTGLQYMFVQHQLLCIDRADLPCSECTLFSVLESLTPRLKSRRIIISEFIQRTRCGKRKQKRILFPMSSVATYLW